MDTGKASAIMNDTITTTKHRPLRRFSQEYKKMIKTLSLYDFRDAWANSSRKDSFSYEGLEIIYDYLEEIDPDYDLDIIGLDCELAEQTAEEIAQDYDIDGAEGLDGEELADAVRNYLQDETTLLGETSAGTFIYVQF
jgi:hypothetical protein